MFLAVSMAVSTVAVVAVAAVVIVALFALIYLCLAEAGDVASGAQRDEEGPGFLCPIRDHTLSIRRNKPARNDGETNESEAEMRNLRQAARIQGKRTAAEVLRGALL
jgi:hypothetical protein